MTDNIRGSDHDMEALTKHITERILTRKFCVVYDKRIDQVWPLTSPTLEAEKAKRNAAIHAFAAERGWKATIRDPGIRVTFRPAN